MSSTSPGVALYSIWAIGDAKTAMTQSGSSPTFVNECSRSGRHDHRRDGLDLGLLALDLEQSATSQDGDDLLEPGMSMRRGTATGFVQLFECAELLRSDGLAGQQIRGRSGPPAYGL